MAHGLAGPCIRTYKSANSQQNVAKQTNNYRNALLAANTKFLPFLCFSQFWLRFRPASVVKILTYDFPILGLFQSPALNVVRLDDVQSRDLSRSACGASNTRTITAISGRWSPSAFNLRAHVPPSSPDLPSQLPPNQQMAQCRAVRGRWASGSRDSNRRWAARSFGLVASESSRISLGIACANHEKVPIW